MSDEFPPDSSNASQPASTDPQKLAASIERDFHSLLESLGLYQTIADPAVVPHVETVKASVERGIRLSQRLRKSIDAQR